MDTDIDTVDTPLAIIVSIAISFIIAVVLLATAPAFLTDYGLAIAYAYAAIMAVWIGIEALHADFEDEQERKRLALIARGESIRDETVAAFAEMGKACGRAIADIQRFNAAWENISRATLIEGDNDQA